MSFLTFLMDQERSPEAQTEAFRQKIREFQQKFPDDDTLAGVKDLNEIDGTEIVMWEEFRSIVEQMKILIESYRDKTENKASPTRKEMYEKIKNFVQKLQTFMAEAQGKNQNSKADFYAWVLNRITPAMNDVQLLDVLNEQELDFILSEINQEIENTK